MRILLNYYVTLHSTINSELKTTMMACSLFHKLDGSQPDDRTLNYPFHYVPDALTMAAVGELQSHLPASPAEGKMWGVLVVDNHGQLGFLNAFSGQIDDRTLHSIDEEWRGCPPVYDYLQPDGYFKTHEAVISDINKRISELSDSAEYHCKVAEYEDLRREADDEISHRREVMSEAKARRDARRREGVLSADEAKAMERESQFLKAEVHRAKVLYRDKLAAMAKDVENYSREIAALKRRRSLLSDHLQAWLFGKFILLNGRGERKAMPDIFRDYGTVCPSGAGECCEPKLLQYAYLHGMRPLRMASFWWGPAPGGELRRNGHFYPACGGRCKPILSWMLQGVDVAGNPLTARTVHKLRIIYDDSYLTVVDKPAGLLSVPGKDDAESVVSILAKRWDGTEPLVVHRLDMATSGLLVVAKDKTTQRLLRREFEERRIDKEYEAIVDGAVAGEKGTVDLPIGPDLLDRPRQKVDFANGKEAHTEYEVIATNGRSTRLRLKPLTGRTHQLRVHCASPEGLNAPIRGDSLYGHYDGGRLCLQARRLSFVHPANGRKMTFTLPPDF